MNFKFIILILFLFLLHHQSMPQEFQIMGTPAPGNILIGRMINPSEIKNIEKIMLDSTDIKFGNSGVFVFGFDRDDTGLHHIRVKMKNGRETVKELSLAKRSYKEQSISNMKQKYVNPPKRELARIEKESNIIKEARAKIGIIDSALYSAGFIRPVKGGRITGVFGSQRILNGIPKSTHNGLDIAAPRGTPVYAATDGIVQLTGKNFYYSGNLILLDHGQGLSSIYIHLHTIDVNEGQKVKKGQLIGQIGTTGRSTGPHLHWGVQWFDKRIDPMSLLEIGSVQ